MYFSRDCFCFNPRSYFKWLEKYSFTLVTAKGPLRITYLLTETFHCLVLVFILIIIVVVYNYVCECTVGVDVRDGPATPSVYTILSNVVMGCIVLGRQMNVYFGTK